MPRILVVDDERGVQESLRMLLKAEGDVAIAGDVEAALRETSVATPDVVLLDLVMPGRSGLDLLAEFEARGVRAPVVVLTATNTVSAAVEAMKLGAADFVTKPFELEALRIKVRGLLEKRALEQEVERLRDEVEERQQLGRMVGRSEAMRAIFRAVERIAKSDATVLVTGESGTGKELVARAIHDLSPRAAGPFVAVNCGAIPRELIESELFGHEKGAFTGATDRRIGRIESAHGGTLFLDEIGELDPAVQVKLLRALQERTFERVGSSRSTSVDVRIVTATNRNLAEEVAAGNFREDLYYRVAVVPVELPPLRERREDVRLLAQTFLARAGGGKKLTPAALASLEGYSWPGNVRELENAIEHGLALCDGDVIDQGDLPISIGRTGQAEALREQWRQGQRGFEETVMRFETEILREALESHHWNQTRTANALGITRRVLKLKMDKLGIEAPGSAVSDDPDED
ncbi:MAG: sigma-54-dependent Fis family transcriptional regulator [Spirochaetaceae bacterium]|nr:sigma-54-dependent Fis family transcriptional regulator [Myxococcales bacterium]MCB9724031.1 sigma-54-dependent Fis family transcriptional regulator [Spirochaetaceae bacterium]HPG25663.1 sigma-54 dependent transcriptional regulator [Myxococcota bacterium]